MVLELKDITKKYNKIVLNKISVVFEKGVYGILGPNASGKTTLMKIICKLEDADYGEILCNGKNITCMAEEYRSYLGYVPQKIGYYPEFTAFEFIEYMAYLKGIEKEKIKEVVKNSLEMVNLNNTGNKKIKCFSGGMKQRLGIAQAILNKPQILVLDEPTVGLDINERIHFKEFLSRYAVDRIVIFSTHIVSDIEDIGNYILMLRSGKFEIKGKLDDVLKYTIGKVWQCECTHEEAMNIRKQYKLSNMKIMGDKAILRILSESKPTDKAIQIEGNLQDLYLMMYN